MKALLLPPQRLAAGLLFLASQLVAAQPGSLDQTFDAGPYFEAKTPLYGFALQPDGKMLLGLGDSLASLRLNRDGSTDTYIPDAPFTVCIAVQSDGKVLFGGLHAYSASPPNLLSRHNADGSRDAAFNARIAPSANPATDGVRCLAIQNDGQIVIGGSFGSIAGAIRNGIARLLPDGTLDTVFNPNANGLVRNIAIQPDGQLVIGGEFTTVGGTARNRLARLHADGTLAPTFNPNASGIVYTVLLQPDGKIVAGGSFGTVADVARNALARINSNGTLDTSFAPTTTALGPAWCTALQTDGRILVLGNGLQVIRLNANGSQETTFANSQDATSQSLALQADGKVLVGGYFTTVNSIARSHLARLNNDFAPQVLSVPDSGRVRWLRGGTSPEVQAVTCELSTDGGGTWTPLGLASRIAGGWQLTGLNLPTAGTIRARARTATGYCNGSSSLLETTHPYVLPAPPTVLTRSAYSVDFSSAKLDGTVNPNGAAGTWHFEYDADPALAGAVSTSLVPFAAGTADLTVGGAIAGLAPASVYYCRAVATTANGTTQGEITNFTTLGTPGDLWRYQHFGAGWMSASFAADYDGDGVANLAEYAFGGDPLAPDSAAILPKADTNNGRLRITFTRDPAHTDITNLEVQASYDLVTWTTLARSASGAATAPSAPGVAVSETALGALKTVQVTDKVVIGSVPRRALRVKVSR